MKIENIGKAIKLQEDYLSLNNLLELLQSGKYKMKISAGLYDQNRIIITPNSDLFSNIINDIKLKINSLESEIEKL